jgi:hypothetical protein
MILGTGQDSLSGDQSAFPTNVTRLSRALSPYALITEDNEEREVEQVIFYQPGVGTQSGQKLRGGNWDSMTRSEQSGNTFQVPTVSASLLIYARRMGFSPTTMTRAMRSSFSAFPAELLLPDQLLGL